MSFRRSNLGFFLMEGFFWATYCTVCSFTVTILREYGFSPEICGLVSTLQCVVIMLVQPFYGYLVDHVTTPKHGFIAMMVLGVLFTLPLPWIFQMDTWIVVGYLTFLSMFVFSGGALADAWAVAVINRTHGMDYAVIRGGGSVLFAFVALLAGYLIAPFGIGILFVLHAVFGCCTIVVALFLVDSTKLENAQPMPPSAAPRASFLQSAKVLLSNRSYVVFTISVCLYNFGIRPFSTYFPVVLESVGGDSSNFGMAMFISAMGEMIFMLVASRMMMRGMAAEYVYLMAMGLLTVRFFLMGVVDSLWLMMTTQLIQAVGFGLQLRINAGYLVGTAPPGYEGMAIMLSGAISNGVGCVLGNLVGGILIESWGVKPYVLLCSGFLAASFFVFLPTVLRKRKERQQQKMEYYMNLHQSQTEKEPT